MQTFHLSLRNTCTLVVFHPLSLVHCCDESCQSYTSQAKCQNVYTKRNFAISEGQCSVAVPLQCRWWGLSRATSAIDQSQVAKYYLQREYVPSLMPIVSLFGFMPLKVKQGRLWHHSNCCHKLFKDPTLAQTKNDPITTVFFTINIVLRWLIFHCCKGCSILSEMENG